MIYKFNAKGESTIPHRMLEFHYLFYHPDCNPSESFRQYTLKEELGLKLQCLVIFHSIAL